MECGYLKLLIPCRCALEPFGSKYLDLRCPGILEKMLQTDGTNPMQPCGAATSLIIGAFISVTRTLKFCTTKSSSSRCFSAQLFILLE